MHIRIHRRADGPASARVEPQEISLRVRATIRLAAEADLPKLEWFGQYTHFRHLYEQTYQEQREGRRLMLVAAVNDFPVGQVFVSLEDGYFDNDGEGPHGYLYALRVMEPFQRLGLGSALVTAAERHLVQRGYRRATIAVAKDNLRAQRLYARLGYHIYKEDPGRWHYVDHEGRTRFVEEPCWLMEKQIPGS